MTLRRPELMTDHEQEHFELGQKELDRFKYDPKHSMAVYEGEDIEDALKGIKWHEGFFRKGYGAAEDGSCLVAWVNYCPLIVIADSVIHDIVIKEVASFRQSKLKTLPRGIKAGALDLYCTNITRIPDETEIRDYIDLVLCLIEEISDSLPDDLNIRYVDEIGVPLSKFREVLAEQPQDEAKFQM